MSRSSTRNCSLPQSVIAKHQSSHRFYDWHCSGKNTRIVAAWRSKPGLLARTSHRFLFVADGSGRLKSDAKINLLPITDAALHAAGIVGCRANFPAAHFKWVVMLRTPHPRRRKTRTDLEAFSCRNAQHRFSQICIELIEDRASESGRDSADHAFNDATNRIAMAANFLDERYHPLCRRSIRTANKILLCLFRVHRAAIDFRYDFVNLRDVSDDLEFL